MKNIVLAGSLLLAIPGLCQAEDAASYRVVTAIRAAGLQQAMQAAANAGFRFSAVSGDTTLSEGKNVVVVMRKDASESRAREYRVIATRNTSAIKEFQEALDGGFAYVAQTVFTGPLHVREAAVLLERDPASTPARFQYSLLITHRPATMEKELAIAGQEGYDIAGLTVGSSAIGVNEIVAVLRKAASD